MADERVVHKSDKPVEDVFEDSESLDLGEERQEKQASREEEEPVELDVSEKTRKTVSDGETEIVEPKQRKGNKGVVGGEKEESEETDIYRPKQKETKWAKEKEVEEEEEAGQEEENSDGEMEDEGGNQEESREEDDSEDEEEEESEEREGAEEDTGKKHEEEGEEEDEKETGKREERKQGEETEDESGEEEVEEEGEEEGGDDTEKENGTREEDIVEDDFDEDEWDLDFEDRKKLSTEGIRKKLIDNAKKQSVKASETSVRLNFLDAGEKNSVFIGRKKSVFAKHGMNAGLYVGKVGEEEHREKDIYLDSLNPHVVFVCGARGSGKSYVLGVIAEELAKKNNNVGTIVIDPIGVFWSMKFPNREKREIEAMADWNLMPEGLDNIKVFVPEGAAKEVPKNTYDSEFSMLPSLLTSEDWCLTFGIDRFSPTGLLLEKTLKKVELGYSAKLEEKKTRKIRGKGRKYDIDDIINCLEHDSELNSRDKGYKQDSIRALVSRFEAAKAWGVFSEKGTPLAELSREGQMTVLDTSFLDDNVTALVIGILARRLLAARKLVTRKEASKKFDKDMDAMLELEVPPTWLFIDEAHTLIPSGNVRTPASTALVEYVKQGRRPGLSLVFATQQPSAIDIRVLSQLDIIMSHKLIFDDDIKSIYKRTPTIIPMKYRKPTFLKTLPVGIALTGDRAEETSRAFVMRIRPRLSQQQSQARSSPKKRWMSSHWGSQGESSRRKAFLNWKKCRRSCTLSTPSTSQTLTTTQ